MIRSLRTLASAVGVVVLVLALSACGSKGDDSSNAPSGPTGATTGAATSARSRPAPASPPRRSSSACSPTSPASSLRWRASSPTATSCTGRSATPRAACATAPLSWRSRTTATTCRRPSSPYRDVAPSVAAIQQLVGSPLTAALLPTLKTDRMLVGPGRVAVLAARHATSSSKSGAPYDIEIINGLGYLKDQGKIKSGDKIGHLYFEGEYGENGLKGVEALRRAERDVGRRAEDPADRRGHERPGRRVQEGRRQGDRGHDVADRSGVLAGIAAAQGLNVPIVGNNPTFDPALLKTPAAKALKANAIIMGSVLPYASKTPKNEKLVKNFSAAYPKDAPKAAAQFGFAQGRVMYAILDQACEDGDLSRDGIVKAARKLSGLKTAGLISGDLDYSQIGEPSTRATFVTKVADVKGGLQQVGEPSASSLAQSYDPSAG